MEREQNNSDSDGLAEVWRSADMVRIADSSRT